MYCDKYYTAEQAEIYGEIWLGAATEYSVTDLDDDGNEDDTTTCYGYIVADCQARDTEDVKRIVCNDAGIDLTETALYVISGSYTTTHYNYEIA